MSSLFSYITGLFIWQGEVFGNPIYCIQLLHRPQCWVRWVNCQATTFTALPKVCLNILIHITRVTPHPIVGFVALLFQTSFPTGTRNGGPTWFLNQLMIFSIVCAFTCGKNWSPKCACLTLMGFLLPPRWLGNWLTHWYHDTFHISTPRPFWRS